MLQTYKPGCALVGALAVLVVAGAGGCGKAGQASADGGDGPLIFPDALAGGRHSFDVVAVLRMSGTNPTRPALPPTSTFTLVLDAEAGLAIVGGNGRGAVVGVGSEDGRTFQSATTSMVGITTSDVCSGGQSVQFDSFKVTFDDGSLSGSARGVANLLSGDVAVAVPFTATLTGTGDATLPTLHGLGSGPANPFDSFRLDTSEPLPVSATARLVGDDGAAVDLVPLIVDGDVPLIVGFSKPDVVLRAGQGYVITLDGLVDFAGLADLTGPPLRFAAFAAAPSVLEDGFESATGSVLGGAMVMTAGPLPAISGNTSLYIGSIGAPALDTSTGRSLLVRLSRQSGDTSLRFSYRVVAFQGQTPFLGTLRIGSEGASTMGPSVDSLGSGSGAGQKVTVAGQAVVAGPVTSAEMTLPGGASDEVLLAITPGTNPCLLLGGTSMGLLIDDLRLE